MDIKDIHNIEQGAALVKEHFTPVLWAFYSGLVDAGFSEQQALYLTNSYMLTILTQRPQSGENTESQQG